jgi:hypothetical protein
MYATDKQDDFLKLFLARYFHVNPEQAALCLGLDRHAAPNSQAYKSSKDRVLDRFHTMRNRIFGNGSYLAKLTHHVVALHDFQATVFNIARLERIADFAVPGESADARATRLALRDRLGAVKTEHLDRLTAARAASTQAAEDELERLEGLVDAKGRSGQTKKVSATELQRAIRTSNFHHKHNMPWAPTSMDSFGRLEALPPPKLMYAYKITAVQQRVWHKEWSLDIAANMLWQTREVVDIPATLLDKGICEYYEAVFTIACHNLWLFVVGVDEEKANLTTALVTAGVRGIAIRMKGTQKASFSLELRVMASLIHIGNVRKGNLPQRRGGEHRVLPRLSRPRLVEDVLVILR